MDIEIYDLDGMEDFERIDSTLRFLIASIAGTIPGSRGFGLSGDTADFAPEDARNELLMELDMKVDQYLPEIAIEDAQIVEAEGGGTLLKLSVAANEEDEE
mgnify:CR=1 FL=1